MKVLPILNGNNKYALLFLKGEIFKVTETSLSEAFVDDLGRYVLTCTRGCDLAIDLETIQKCLRALHSDTAEYTILTTAPNFSYVALLQGKMYLINADDKVLINQKFIKTLEKAQETSLLSAISRAAKIVILKELEKEHDVLFYVNAMGSLTNTKMEVDFA
jgi:hypothetical protein